MIYVILSFWEVLNKIDWLIKFIIGFVWIPVIQNCLSLIHIALDMEVYEPKWVNTNYIWYGVN